MKAWLTKFWSWWHRELAAMLPGELAAMLPTGWHQRQEQDLALWRQGGLSLWRRAGGKALPAEGRPGERPLLLRLAEQKIWRRDFTLPHSAHPYLRQIFENEMDRRTPWRAEQVYFDVRAERHPQGREKILVHLSLLPRKSLEPALAELAARGWTADALELCDSADPALVAPQLRLADGRPGGPAAGPGGWPLRIAAALLSLALLSLIGQEIGWAVMEARLAAARQQAAATKSLASEIARLQRRQNFPLLRQQESASALATLDALSRALPDDSWAEEFDLADGQVAVIGRSSDAARLLALVEQQGFQGAQFRAPITPAEGGGQKFQLAARLTEKRRAAP